jgi:hypothetical protein
LKGDRIGEEAEEEILLTEELQKAKDFESNGNKKTMGSTSTGTFAKSLGGSRYDIMDEYSNMDCVRSLAKKLEKVAKVFQRLVRTLWKEQGMKAKDPVVDGIDKPRATPAAPDQEEAEELSDPPAGRKERNKDAGEADNKNEDAGETGEEADKKNEDDGETDNEKGRVQTRSSERNGGLAFCECDNCGKDSRGRFYPTGRWENQESMARAHAENQAREERTEQENARNAQVKREMLARLQEGYNIPGEKETEDEGMSEETEETQKNTVEQTIDMTFETTTESDKLVHTGELTTDLGEPNSLREAVTGPDKDRWILSIKLKIETFKKHGAWKLVTREEVNELGRKQIPMNKTVFKKVKTEQERSWQYYNIGDKKILTGIDDEWVLEKYDVEAAFLNLKMGTRRMMTKEEALIGGLKSEVEAFYDEFEQYLKIERLGKLKKHLGVWWTWGTDENGDPTLTADMNDMIDAIEKKFVACRGKGAKKASTPGFPGTCLAKLKEGEEQVDIDGYRSIVGKLLYLMTKIGPTYANAARELSAHMSNPGEVHWKALERLVGYLSGLPKSKRGLTLRKPVSLRGMFYSDSGYNMCPDTSKSVSGGHETIGGTTLGWFSRKAATVALSTSEAEYIAYGIAAQGMVFLHELLGEIIGTVEKPGVIFEDNMGCIFMIKNPTTSVRTKHIRARAHFVRDLREQQEVEPVFCPSDRMLADGMTKNQPEKLFVMHRDEIHSGDLRVRREDVKDLLNTSDRVPKAVHCVTSEEPGSGCVPQGYSHTRDHTSDIEAIGTIGSRTASRSRTGRLTVDVDSPG